MKIAPIDGAWKGSRVSVYQRVWCLLLGAVVSVLEGLLLVLGSLLQWRAVLAVCWLLLPAKGRLLLLLLMLLLLQALIIVLPNAQHVLQCLQPFTLDFRGWKVWTLTW